MAAKKSLKKVFESIWTTIVEMQACPTSVGDSFLASPCTVEGT